MRRIAVFARWPEPGRVKTRLSPALPAALACDLHRAMLADALAVAATIEAGERFLYWDRAPEGAGPETPLGGPAAEFARRVQSGADLGARLAAAFAEMLPDPNDRAVVIGSDCPDLTGAIVDAAFAALETSDLVVGPAADGGYYLIGLSRPAPSLFRGIEWGGEQVRAQTLRAASSAGLRVEPLPPLDDLDTPADLVRWLAARITESGEESLTSRSGTATAEALRRMKLLP